MEIADDERGWRIHKCYCITQTKRHTYNISYFERKSGPPEPGKVQNVIKAIDEANFSQIVGNWELDMRDGEVRMKACSTTMLLSESSFTCLLLTTMERTLISMAKLHKPLKDAITCRDAKLAETPIIPKQESPIKQHEGVAGDLNRASNVQEVSMQKVVELRYLIVLANDIWKQPFDTT